MANPCAPGLNRWVPVRRERKRRASGAHCRKCRRDNQKRRARPACPPAPGVRPRDAPSHGRTRRERPHPQFTRSSPARVAVEGGADSRAEGKGDGPPPPPPAVQPFPRPRPGGGAGRKGRPRPGPGRGRGRGMGQVRAGSMSTTICRHLPCRNRATLSELRVKWPSTMASQMSAGCRPRVCWKAKHSPSGTMICEMIEM